MHPSEKRPPAQGKAIASLVLAFLLTVTFVQCREIVAVEAEGARSNRVITQALPLTPRGAPPPAVLNYLSLNHQDIHSAAPSKIVVPPKHRAAAILPVVDQDDIRVNQRMLADQVLRALPSFCRDHLQNFYVLYEKNPKNRGLGGESTIIITGNVPDKEFMALLTHECGHVTDLGGIRGNPDSGETAFRDGNTPIYADDPSIRFYQISWLSATQRRKNAKDTDFVSGYAASDAFEDFAEAFAYYALQQKEFKRLAAKNPVLRAKYNFMEQVVFAETGPIANGSHIRGKRVPWDVTKLPYTWHAKR